MDIYIDGSCLDNGSRNNFGGYGIVILNNDTVIKHFSIGKINTTNNEMELMALLKTVTYCNKAFTNINKINIYSDSSYVVNIVNDWMYRWKINGWKKSNGRQPENLKIIQSLYKLLNFNSKYIITKVKGHSTVKYNNLADQLATNASINIKQKYIKKLAR